MEREIAYANFMVELNARLCSGEITISDPLLPEAERYPADYGKASAQLLQDRFKIGYTRAVKIISVLESKGIIGSGENFVPHAWFLSTGEEFEEYLTKPEDLDD